jgi:hypothetical protein
MIGGDEAQRRAKANPQGRESESEEKIEKIGAARKGEEREE